MKNLLLTINSWNEFKSSVHGLNTKDKGDAFEILNKYYLLLDPVYKSILSEVWLLSEVPRNISKKLNLPNQDKGIDLIAQTNTGEYWAIQSKYRHQEDGALTWEELSTFIGLSYGKCKNISYCMVATSKNSITKLLDDVGCGLLAGDTWRNLDEDFFKQLHARLENKIVKIKPFAPRPHQISAIKNASKHYLEDKNSRGKMIMPCGAGKSLTAFWIARELNAKSVIIAVPSLSLVRQTLKAWLREVVANKIDVDWICVCSDQHIGKMEKDEFQFLNHDLGVEAKTDIDFITKWLRKRRKGISVVFTTYQSGKVIAEASRNANKVFDLGIMDEAHKTVGDKDKTFSHLIYDENIKIRQRVFMTATERRFQGNSDQIASMDNPEIYGDTFDLLSFKQALEQKEPILSDYKIITIAVSKGEIEEMIRKNFFIKPDTGQWNDKLEAEMMASIIALRRAMHEEDIKHALSFHSSVAKAKVFQNNQASFSDAVPEYAEIDAFHVSAKINASERDKIIKEEFIPSSKALMTNARCLTEGVDVPAIDCVLFSDPKKSTIDIVQAVGRALRRFEGKKYGYVIVPVIVDEDNFEDKNVYEPILMVLRALAANDERIIDYFRAKSNNERSDVNIDIKVPEKISELIDTKDFIQSVELKIWHRLAKLSWMPFEEAKEYVQRLGLNSFSEWKKYCNGKYTHLPEKPADIPIDFRTVYKDKGFISTGDFLGTKFIAYNLREYRDYDSSRKFVIKLNLKSISEWNNYTQGKYNYLPKLPEDISKSPAKTYDKNGWINWGHWLGTGRIADQDRAELFVPYKKAKGIVRKLNLKSTKDWKNYIKGLYPSLPLIDFKKVPRNPQGHYSRIGSWQGWPDFLGYSWKQRKKYIPFEDAKEFVHKLKLKNKKEWFMYFRGALGALPQKPQNIPDRPNIRYKGKWIDWEDWLGITTQTSHWMTFEEAKIFVKKLKIESIKDWNLFCRGDYATKRPYNLPSSPSDTYKDDWLGWGDFLGTGRIADQYKTDLFLSYDEAKLFIHPLKLNRYGNSRKCWRAWCRGDIPALPEKYRKRPENIPSNADAFYKKTNEWKGWKDFLGYED